MIVWNDQELSLIPNKFCVATNQTGQEGNAKKIKNNHTYSRFQIYRVN